MKLTSSDRGLGSALALQGREDREPCCQGLAGAQLLITGLENLAPLPAGFQPNRKEVM
jgi:hypothetical protein